MAGGKNWISKDLIQYLPARFNNYIEPFLGGGSVALYLKQQGLLNNQILLSDANQKLISFYIHIRDYPKKKLKNSKNIKTIKKNTIKKEIKTITA